MGMGVRAMPFVLASWGGLLAGLPVLAAGVLCPFRFLDGLASRTFPSTLGQSANFIVQPPAA